MRMQPKASVHLLRDVAAPSNTTKHTHAPSKALCRQQGRCLQLGRRENKSTTNYDFSALSITSTDRSLSTGGAGTIVQCKEYHTSRSIYATLAP